MNRRVNFKTLWLVSARDGKARMQQFSDKTLLLGSNGTGKSRITKNLLWALGCPTRKQNAGHWDPDTAAAVEFEFGAKRYMSLRRGKQLGMFDGEGTLLFAADKLTSWDRLASEFFGFKLELRRPNSNVYAPAGVSYMMLPYYMDQDGSWGADWDTFESLGQFSKWKEETFQAFIGLHPNAYFVAKHQRDDALTRIKEREHELDAQQKAFKRVEDVLPKRLPSLNISAFRSELAELGRKALKLQQEQVRVRTQLLHLVNARQKLESEIKVAQRARGELAGDFEYLEKADASIECPTCGTVHANSFHARLQLSSDLESLNVLIDELRTQLRGTESDEARVRSSLRQIERSIGELDKLRSERRARLKLEDVLASQSKRTLDDAFERVSNELGAVIKTLTGHRDLAELELKKYTDAERLKNVRQYFQDQFSSLSNLLGVPPSEQIADPKPGSRSQSGGSSAPRSLLAMHLAMLATNAEWGDTPLFPFVADTLQQSGQDDTNLRRMIDVLGRAAGYRHQVILAVERLPDDVSLGEFSVIRLDNEGSVLNEDAFREVSSQLSVPMTKLQDALKPRVENDA
ncbi:hypothetical protein KTD31_29385 [Burkholderia multivorans]|uniref:hypothetical protein n=1 Tax=Burkholderia multivorans TaxID=87883 RepID=UPI001C21EA28|nr:hypothetical protein [Burkholderia multivorans]MBU9205477.1 hypothetical protein [Burkholderia multivorans]MDN7842706.1 hypothetical protein [Burkholderia multivorans]